MISQEEEDTDEANGESNRNSFEVESYPKSEEHLSTRESDVSSYRDNMNNLDLNETDS